MQMLPRQSKTALPSPIKERAPAIYYRANHGLEEDDDLERLVEIPGSSVSKNQASLKQFDHLDIHAGAIPSNRNNLLPSLHYLSNKGQ